MTKTYNDLLSITKSLDDKRVHQSLYGLLKHPAQNHNSFFLDNDAANLRMLDEYITNFIDDLQDVDDDTCLYSHVIDLTNLSNRITHSPITFKSLIDAGGWFDGLMSGVVKGINPGCLILSRTIKPDFSDINNIVCSAFTEMDVIDNFTADKTESVSLKKNANKKTMLCTVDYSVVNSSKLFCVKDSEIDDALAISNAVQALRTSKLNYLPMPDDFAIISLANNIEAITNILKENRPDLANENKGNYIKITIMPLASINIITNKISAVVIDHPLWPQFLDEVSQFPDPVFITISINPLLIPEADLLKYSVGVFATKHVANTAISTFLEDFE